MFISRIQFFVIQKWTYKIYYTEKTGKYKKNKEKLYKNTIPFDSLLEITFMNKKSDYLRCIPIKHNYNI